jgi:6-phosphogluconolactonase
MHRSRFILLVFALLASLVSAAAANASSSNRSGAVYTLTNAPSGNAVIVFDRASDGSLTPAGSFATGGSGTGAGLGSQGALALSEDRKLLFAVNAGSNSISELAVRPHGLDLVSTISSGGTLPISLTVHGDLLYVLNAGGAGNISGFVVGSDGLSALAGSTRPLGTGSAGPAEVAFGPGGHTVVVTEKTSGTIDTYAVGADGLAASPTVSPSAGITPFGFDFDAAGHLLVSEAGGSASSYSVAASGVSVISAAVATHQGAPCWLVAAPGGFAYTANAGSGTISGFAVAGSGTLSLLDASGVTADLGSGSHPLDESVSPDGRFLYNLTDGRHAITGFRIAEDGGLVQVGVATGLPAGTVGLVAS